MNKLLLLSGLSLLYASCSLEAGSAAAKATRLFSPRKISFTANPAHASSLKRDQSTHSKPNKAADTSGESSGSITDFELNRAQSQTKEVIEKAIQFQKALDLALRSFDTLDEEKRQNLLFAADSILRHCLLYTSPSPRD